MSNIMSEIIQSDIFQIILRLLLSAFLAGIIGLERSALSKPAGFGTYSIIGLSSALVVMASTYMAAKYEIDAARIPSQILAGIGFIGAGTIVRNGFNVKGVTTAAGILSVTCIGMAVGMGYFEAAVITTLIVFFILSVNHDVTSKFERFESVVLFIIAENNFDKALDDIKDYFKKEDISIDSISKEEAKKSNVIKVSISYDNRKIQKSDIVSTLISKKSIKEVIEENNS